ncbi:MAG: DUF3090 family protein [Dehalococcoidia bacterium]|nr:DUF3090 family protein [Dehalococcoidia bacterium]
MEAAEHDYGQTVSIDAEAIGRPGQRRFRLVARSATACAAIWMEKQQLASIGDWLVEMLKRLDDERPPPEPEVEPLPPTEAFDLSFRASQIALGFAEEANLFAIQAFEEQRAGDSDDPTFRCFIGRGQARALSRKIEAVVSAGRRLCPLCDQPIDPEGHVCPRSNGHHTGAAV